MSFTLRIAAATDKNVLPFGVPPRTTAPSASVVTIVTGGCVRDSDVVRIGEACRQQFEGGADTVVIELHDITFDDTKARQDFVAIVLAERSNQCHLFVCPSDEAARASLAGEPDASAWLLPLDSEDTTPRRSFVVHSPIVPPSSGSPA